MDVPGNAVGIVIDMKPGMKSALFRLEGLIEADETISGLVTRAHGENLILGYVGEADSGEAYRDDRVRLTRLSQQHWGLSVKRHTGRWERTPFSGTMIEMLHVVGSVMQHLVAPD